MNFSEIFIRRPYRALPMAVGYGAGSEARRPLGLFFSQLMTLYLTPVVYTYLSQLTEYLTTWKQRRAMSMPHFSVRHKYKYTPGGAGGFACHRAFRAVCQAGETACPTWSQCVREVQDREVYP